MSTPRIGRTGLHRLRSQLSDRDMQILLSVRSFRLLQIQHIKRLHFVGHATDGSASRICRRVLKRLSDLRLLTRLDRRIGGQRAGSAGFVYSLSPLGHRILGTPTRHRHREPSFGFVAHTLAIAELATSLIEYAWVHHSDKTQRLAHSNRASGLANLPRRAAPGHPEA